MKIRVKRTTRTETVEAEYWTIEHGGTLSLYNHVHNRVKSFNVRDWVDVEEAKSDD